MINNNEDIEVDVFDFKNTEAINIITIYYDTLDYKSLYIARLFEITASNVYATKTVCIKKTYDEIIRSIPKHMVKLLRNEQDDKNIIESWI